MSLLNSKKQLHFLFLSVLFSCEHVVGLLLSELVDICSQSTLTGIRHGFCFLYHHLFFLLTCCARKNTLTFDEFFCALHQAMFGSLVFLVAGTQCPFERSTSSIFCHWELNLIIAF